LGGINVSNEGVVLGKMVNLARKRKAEDKVCQLIERELYLEAGELILSENLWEMFIMIVLRMDLQPFHRKMFKFQLDNKETLVLGPRGFGKSWICNRAFVLWNILKNPDIRLVVVSKTLAQAKLQPNVMKLHFQDPVFISFFGEWYSRDLQWDQLRFTVKKRTKILDTPTLTALGLESTIRARHVDLIVCDDLVDKNNCRGIAAVRTIETFINEILPMMLAGGRIHVNGTTHSPEDLHAYIMKNKLMKTLKIKALYYDSEGKPHSIWESFFPTEELLRRKRIMGTLRFNLEYQMDFSQLEGNIISPYWLITDRTDFDRSTWLTGIGIDPASGSGPDETCFVVVGINPDYPEKVYILDYLAGKFSYEQIKSHLINLEHKWNTKFINMEVTGFKMLHDQLLQDGFDIKGSIASESKVMRFTKYLTKFENGHIIFNEEIDWDKMFTQLLTFPHSKHDDCVDALYYALEGISERTFRPPIKIETIQMKPKVIKVFT